MSEENLQKRVEELLEHALTRTKGRNALKALHRKLGQACERLQQPMRVAIVGLIKAGKSTMMNALLGETLVPTGEIEATFNVNWFKYGSPASLLVHFKDNRPPEARSFEDLEMLTRRSEEQRDYLLNIKYIEVSYPARILSMLNLIDTPGLASFYKDDSQGTIDFLKLYGEDLNKATLQEADHADAVLYLFSHSMAESDLSIVETFQGPMLGQATPINSIGVLTKSDMYWPQRDDALAGGNEVIERLQRDHPQIRRPFYTIMPICGFLAWGAQTLTSEEFAVLQELARLPEEIFEKITLSIERFNTRVSSDVPVSPETRKLLARRLDLYGIVQACKLLRPDEETKQARVTTQAELVEALVQLSGLPPLKSLILSHFGNRAYLIKLDVVMKQLGEACFWARQSKTIQGIDREILQEIESELGRLKDNEPAFSEFSVLRDHYQGRLQFSAHEVEQLLQVTGEHGLSERARLGLSPCAGTLTEADLREIVQTARTHAEHWRRREIDPGANRETEKAAHILGDAYDRIGHQALVQIQKLGVSY